MKALGYIAHLIAHPGHRTHVLDLFAQVGGSAAATAPTAADLQAANLEVASDLGDASEVVDSRARAEYRQRLSRAPRRTGRRPSGTTISAAPEPHAQ